VLASIFGCLWRRFYIEDALVELFTQMRLYDMQMGLLVLQMLQKFMRQTTDIIIMIGGEANSQPKSHSPITYQKNDKSFFGPKQSTATLRSAQLRGLIVYVYVVLIILSLWAE